MSTARPQVSSCVELIAGVSDGLRSTICCMARSMSSLLVKRSARPIMTKLRQCELSMISSTCKQTCGLTEMNEVFIPSVCKEVKFLAIVGVIHWHDIGSAFQGAP